jgi:hypothetical protein
VSSQNPSITGCGFINLTRSSAYSGAMDIILVFIPWGIIWTLTLNKKEKAGVLLAMSMGIL